jgi:hypothetical protein
MIYVTRPAPNLATESGIKQYMLDGNGLKLMFVDRSSAEDYLRLFKYDPVGVEFIVVPSKDLERDANASAVLVAYPSNLPLYGNGILLNSHVISGKYLFPFVTMEDEPERRFHAFIVDFGKIIDYQIEKHPVSLYPDPINELYA